MKLLKPLETSDCPVQRAAAHQRTAALGPPGAGRADQVHRVDRRRQAAPPGLPRPARRQEARGRPSRTEVARHSRPTSRARPAADASGDPTESGLHATPRRPGAATEPADRNELQAAERRTANRRRPASRRSNKPAATASSSCPDGDRLKVTNLHKVFWPKLKLTKGDLLRYYAQVAPYMLPAVADRPLVMKRFPNGVAGPPFYQHRAPDVPPGVRVETVVGGAKRRPQIIGGNLTTLLYMTQLAAISQDPWFSRVQSSGVCRLCRAGSRSGRRREVRPRARRRAGDPRRAGHAGRRRRAEDLGRRRAAHLHPAAAGHALRAGLLFCQIVATVVAQKHPKIATVERSVRSRGTRVYVDYLQNILGKTLATAYSARASEYAGVSTPLTWEEVDAGRPSRGFHDRDPCRRGFAPSAISGPHSGRQRRRPFARGALRRAWQAEAARKVRRRDRSTK